MHAGCLYSSPFPSVYFSYNYFDVVVLNSLIVASFLVPSLTSSSSIVVSSVITGRLFIVMGRLVELDSKDCDRDGVIYVHGDGY